MRLPLLRGGRPLKRWRYVGVFGEELLACAAVVHVGPARQCFWTVYQRGEGVYQRGVDALAGSNPQQSGNLGDGDRGHGDDRGNGGNPRERTHILRRRGAVALPPGRLVIRDGDVLLELALREEDGIRARCLNGDQVRAHGETERALDAHEVWTRKQAGVRASGSLTIAGRPARAIEAFAAIDDTIGYHPRVTAWWWSAGVGLDAAGRGLAWNLVQGVNDPPLGSERAVWIDGEPHEVPPVRFATDLAEIHAEDGSRLCFSAEAERRRRENLLLLRSDYVALLGSFHGALPGGVTLAEGLGVMERHRAWW